ASRAPYGKVIFSAAHSGSALCCLRPFGDLPCGFRNQAGVAQLVELLICNQAVGGSNPFASSSLRRDSGREAVQRRVWLYCLSGFLLSNVRQPIASVLTRQSLWRQRVRRAKGSPEDFRQAGGAQVAEWLMAADCKSAAQRATEVRILPCAPSSWSGGPDE